MTTTVLIHGGFWTGMDAERFWVAPGVADGLVAAGHVVLRPDRELDLGSWDAEVRHLLPGLPPGPLHVVAASNGCSLGVRIALAPGSRVTRLVLVHPATAGDPVVDLRLRGALTSQGVHPTVVDGLLAGGILRGVDDAELRTLDLPVAVVPAPEGDPGHQRATVDSLRSLLPHSRELTPCAPPPAPDFAADRSLFLREVDAFLGAPPHAV